MRNGGSGAASYRHGRIKFTRMEGSMGSQSALSLIEAHRSDLRNSEVKVANYILSYVEDVIHLSISELADAAGVSEPTVIRFCRNIGYKGFQDFKISLAQSIVPSIRNIHEAVDEFDPTPGLIQKVFQSNINAIRNSMKTIDASTFEAAVNVLANSERIIFFGCGGSGAVAMDAYHKFFRIGIPCAWFNDTHMAAMAATMMTEKQTFVVISHSGSTKDVVEALKLANASNAATIAIVSQEKSPVSKIARYIFRVEASEKYFKPEPMSSRIAQLSVIDSLCVGVSLLRKEAVLSNLTKTRKALIDKRF